MASFGSPSKSKWEAEATAFFDATIYRGTLLQPEWMANARAAVEAVLDNNLVNTRNLKLFRKLASRLPTRTAEHHTLKSRADLKISEAFSGLKCAGQQRRRLLKCRSARSEANPCPISSPSTGSRDGHGAGGQRRCGLGTGRQG